jgi:signal transduction histidine kinase
VTVAAALLLAVVLAGFAAVVVGAQRESREALEDRFRLRSALAAGAVDAFLADLIREEKVIATDWFGAKHVTATEFSRVSRRFGFSAALLLDRRGRVLAVHPHEPALIGREIGSRYVHLRSALRGHSRVSDVVRSAAEGRPVVGIAVPFNTRGGRRVFSGALPVGGTALGTYLRTSVPLAVGVAELRDSRGRRIAGSGSKLPRNGSVFVAASPVEETGWTVELAAPRSQLLAPISGLARWVPWLLFAGFAVAAVLILFLVLRILESRTALANRNLEITRLMRTQQQFLASTSHELRTPLTSVLGYLDHLLKGQAGAFTSQQRQLLQIVRRNAGRLLDLVADLMLAAQIDAGKLELDRRPIALEELARETVETALPMARDKRIELVHVGAEEVPVLADAGRLAQIVGNLVSNAVKFTPEQGRIEVRSFRENGSGVIEVTDTGMGIPPEDQPRIFQRFFRSSTALAEEVPGTGLGLSIARQLTELHGGRLAFTSEEGVGSTFRIELPTSR